MNPNINLPILKKLETDRHRYLFPVFLFYSHACFRISTASLI